jgi:ATP-dependent helicase YprA (DUF1998 family)
LVRYVLDGVGLTNSYPHDTMTHREGETSYPHIPPVAYPFTPLWWGSPLPYPPLYDTLTGVFGGTILTMKFSGKFLGKKGSLYLLNMKYIINETQYKKLISENTRVVQLERYIDLLTKIIKNYDKIDCNDEYMLYSNNYAELYCEQLQDRSLDEISTVRQKMIDEVNDLVNREFMSKYGSLSEVYEQIKVRNIPNDLIPFSNKDISMIEGVVSNLNSTDEIKLKRQDKDYNRFPRIVIYTENNYGENVMYLYKNTKGLFFVHTRHNNRYEDQSLNSYSLKSLNDLPSLFLATENRVLFNLKS